MSYNGSGTFVINSTGQPVVTGTVISSTAFNALTADLATGLSTAITKDGQTTTTVRVPFAAGISSTLTTDATSSTTGSIITAGGISCQKALFVGTTSQHVGAATFNGRITQSLAPVAAEYALRSTGQTTGWIAIDMANTGGDYIIAGENSTGNNLIVGDSAYDMVIRGPSGISFSANAGTTQHMRLTSAGLLGIGMTPSNVLDITQSQNAASIGRIFNGTSGTAGSAEWRASNDVNDSIRLISLNQSYTTSGVFAARKSVIASDGVGLAITTMSAQTIQFGTNNVDRMRVGATGTLMVNGTTGTGYTATFYSDAYSNVDVYIESSNGVVSGTSGVIRVSKNSGNNRSINATGTINASGADYAEYMVKSDGCGVIAKGDVIGVDADGNLTDKYDNAHSFVIKSTNPSYVGGDSWSDGNPAVGPRPEPASTEDEAEKAVLEAELVKWKERHEAARATVDRIAFSGQVPVNVTGATVGDYIIPVADATGGITGKPVTDPTFDQYRAAVGRVWKILEDGRAFVSVKVS